MADDAEGGVRRQVAALYEILAGALGKDKVIMRAGKLGALKLMRLNRRNVELLALTRLHTVFEVFAEEQDAVNSFFPGREIKRFDILSFVRHMQEE